MPSIPSNLKPRPDFAFEAIGTHWRIETSEPLSRQLRAQITGRIEEFDQTYSRFRDDSLVAEIAQRAGRYEFPPDVIPLITFYYDLYRATAGRVTPLIGKALEESGYGSGYSLTPGKVSAVPAWDEVMVWQGNAVTTHRPLVLDVGAAGKGYLVDIMGELLEEAGIGRYVIDASGDIRHRGEELECIGLEHPLDTTKVIGVMNMRNASLCASATNRRQWGKGLHHVFDPFSASPTRSVAATWVRADSTMVADGVATALFFMEAEQLYSHWDFQYARLKSDGTLSHSHEFMGELFI